MRQVRTKRARLKVMSLPSLWRIYRDTMLAGAPEHDMQHVHDAFYGAILAYSKALNHVLKRSGVRSVTESIRKLASTTAVAQNVARGATH